MGTIGTVCAVLLALLAINGKFKLTEPRGIE